MKVDKIKVDLGFHCVYFRLYRDQGLGQCNGLWVKGVVLHPQPSETYFKIMLKSDAVKPIYQSKCQKTFVIIGYIDSYQVWVFPSLLNANN